MFKQKANKRNLSVCVWVRTHLLILVCVCEWELTSRFQCVSEWELTSWFECVCVWVGENSPPHLCLWVRERTHLPSALPSNHTSDNLLANRILDGWTDGHTRFSAQTLNPKPEHTQEDTHYTKWYPNIEGYPDTEWYPLHWMIPITDTPKRIPITLSDTHYYNEWYRYPEWFFFSLTVLTTHPRVYPLHWGTLFSSQTNRTLSDTHDTEGYPWH
jgi:hypothetical protein